MENEQMRLIKIHLTLLNAAVHAIAAALPEDARAEARGLFDGLAESAQALLLSSTTTDSALSFFDELRGSISSAMAG